EEDRKKKDEEDRKKKDEEDRKKKDEEDRKKKDEEDRKKKDEEDDEAVDESGLSGDFVTVTTAEIFIKQGLLEEAEKILKKIIKENPENIEAKMKFDEIKKRRDKKDGGDDKPGKGKASKVSYI
ncbi:MAG: tetratricopeptide repeat protein, partial [Candidatus Goldiibacteriota bacterium]